MSDASGSALASRGIAAMELSSTSTSIQNNRSSRTERRPNRRAAVLVACSILQLPIWGFAMTYGIFQEYYLDHWTFKGDKSAAGVIGTTSNGVMYMLMPFLFAGLSRRFAKYRFATAILGLVIASVGFVLSAFATSAWQLVITQGVLAALGCVMVYSPTTLSLNEHYSAGNKALALGVVLSAKNITGSTCPFLLHYLLNKYGYRTTMLAWAALTAGIALGCLIFMPLQVDGALTSSDYRPRRVPWSFLRHKTIHICCFATIMQSSGYGIPQTYLNTYASTIVNLSATSATLLLVLFNAPGIISSSFFGFLSDNQFLRLSATSTAAISAVCSALAALFFWGFAGPSNHSFPLLAIFAMVFGFFAGGYSATWGGVMEEMEKESADRNEAIDTGVVYGLLNGARGIGYVGGGLAGVQLLNAGEAVRVGASAYSTSYGLLILYTGLATLLGGWGVAFKCSKWLGRF